MVLSVCRSGPETSVPPDIVTTGRWELHAGEPWVLGRYLASPCLDACVLVGALIVEDHVDGQPFEHLAVDGAQEPQELGVAVPR